MVATNPTMAAMDTINVAVARTAAESIQAEDSLRVAVVQGWMYHTETAEDTKSQTRANGPTEKQEAVLQHDGCKRSCDDAFEKEKGASQAVSFFAAKQEH